MKNILLPVDGSAGALEAVKHVVKRISGKENRKVTLLYVHLMPVHFGSVAPELAPGDIKKIEQEFGDAVLAEAEKLLRDANIEFTREVRAASDAGLTIARRAQALDCDRIVMGKHGGGALSRLLLGSTATKVSQLVEIPVVLVG